MIFCRNVLIYFTNNSRERVIRKMVDVLRPGGLIVLSPTESIYGICSQLQLVEYQNNYFYRYTNDERLDRDTRYWKKMSSPPLQPADTEYALWGLFKRDTTLETPKTSAADKEHAENISNESILGTPWRLRYNATTRDADIEDVNRRAQDAYHCGERRRAIRILQAYVLAHPKDVLPRITLANALTGTKDLSRAEEEYSKALDTDPFLSETHFFLGMLHRKTGNYEQSIKSMKNALFLDKALWLASFYLAGMLSKIGDKNQAIIQYQNTIYTIDETNTKTIIFNSLLHGMENVMQYRNDIRQLCVKKISQMQSTID